MSVPSTPTPRRCALRHALVVGTLSLAAIAALSVDAGANDPDDRAPTVRTVTVTATDRAVPAGDPAATTTLLEEAIAERAGLVAETPPPATPVAEAAEPTGSAHSGNVPIATWEAVARCESGYGGEPNWDINTGNGFYGGLQFTRSSWEWVGGTGMPHEASRETQIEMAERLWERQGWNAWPACSRALGLR